ncbi:MAG TPA: CrcB family protein [Acidimicrobiia bacterium]
MRDASGRRWALLVVVAAGGALGAPARYGIAQLLPVQPGVFPWATFWTNVSGALLIGLFVTGVLERMRRDRYVRPFFVVGFLGSFTTFSTLATETATLVKEGEVALAVGYTVASIVVGSSAAFGGLVIGRLLTERRAARETVV